MNTHKLIAAAALATVALGSIAFADSIKSELAHEKGHNSPVCARGAEEVRCHARVETDAKGAPQAATLPAGLGPRQFHAAYASATSASTKQIIAIVDAYDHPNAYSDLVTYSQTFGIPVLPQCSGSIASSNVPCFQKINQRGSTSSFPQTNAGWALEIAMDIEAAHAMCQNCSILLVEADSASFANLMNAFDQAITKGATVVSNSYGASEFSGQTAYDFHFNRPGVGITVSSGDAGYGAEYPAASRYVTAVGGTTLTFDSLGNYASEKAWSGAGSGCSAYEAKQPWQTDTGCADKRTIADVSAVADPATGAAVYSSVRYQGAKGWFKVGGTSLSAPLIAGVYALAGGVPAGVQGVSLPYASVASNLHDVTTGSNGTCGATYLCTAVAGFDGPTGLGTPNGLGAF